MLSYVIRRCLALLPVLLVVSIVVFSIVHLTPGDAAQVMLGPNATEDQVERLREEMGLNEPIFIQYFAWLGGVLTGDLGYSHFMHANVTEVLFEHLGPTLSLALLAELVALVIAIPAGITAARCRGTDVDQGFMIAALLGISVPSFLLGLFLMLIFAGGLGLFPVAGYRELSDGLGQHLKYLVLPAIALGAMQAALTARMARSSMLEVLKAGYMKTALAKGVSPALRTYKHALKNASLPILTVIGQSIGTLVAGAAVVETVFNIPGIGQLIVNSVERRDFVVIQGVVLLITVSYMLVNLLVDLLYGVLDPRVRLAK